MTKLELANAIAEHVNSDDRVLDVQAVVKEFKAAELKAILEGCGAKDRGWDAELDEFFIDPDVAPKTMAKTLAHYRIGYQPCVAASGRKSLNNGDELASLLSGLDHLEVAHLATKLLLEDDDQTFFDRYSHLNNGQIRMNCGNRIRAALKKGDLTIDEIAKAI